jgi:ADP-heptose:LPS heptosyltransferase
MMSYEYTLEAILKMNKRLEGAAVKRVLFLYEQKAFLIGDTCIRFGNFRICRSFFQNAEIDLCFNEHDKYASAYNALLKNRPDIDHIYTSRWEMLDFSAYDVVICVLPDEHKLLRVLHGLYGDLISAGNLATTFYSMSTVFIYQAHRGPDVFPVYRKMLEHGLTVSNNLINEIVISAEEREWANAWLEEQGIKKHQPLFVLPDSASRREKILNIEVYFRVVAHLLEKDIRLLVFDEKGIGKEAIYREWLTQEQLSKIIFSRQLTLRQDLCLIGSDYTRLVFGPCTGLLHCASAIYNHYVAAGMSPQDVPALITYTGNYPDDENAQHWWGTSPLMNCLVLKNVAGEPKAILLQELPDEEKTRSDNVLSCAGYTPALILDHIEHLLKHRTRQNAHAL